jgi:hypothetical protein
MQLASLKNYTLRMLSVSTIILAGCGTSDVTFREGKANEQKTTNVVPRNSAMVVHVDTNERITTIRRGFSLGEKFLISMTPTGVETAILKGRARSEGEGLMTADILEGVPQINNVVVPASRERSQRLESLYPDSE